jgi:hypothetical protein
VAIKKIIRALAVIALLAAVGNYAKMRYFTTVSNLANSSVVQYDFIKNWGSETAKIEAEKYFGRPVSISDGNNEIVQITANFSQKQYSEINAFLDRLQTISWVRLHKVAVRLGEQSNFILVEAIFLTK